LSQQQQTPQPTSGLMTNGIGLSGKNQNPNQRNQYFGNPQQPSTLNTQYGAQSGQSSLYIPITSDFSKFSK
jgi:hypothetical protein